MNTPAYLSGFEALRLLRLMIPSSTHTPPNGLPIPITETNIECGAHAMTAAFVFSCCGIKTRIAKGMAIVLLPGFVTPVLNHYFIRRQTDGAVFDSSLTVPLPPTTTTTVNGIDFDGCPDQPSLRVFTRQRNPDSKELERLMEAGESFVIYVEHTSWRPDEMIDHKVESGFGRWVESTYGSQQGFYARLGWALANLLLSGQAAEFREREALIELIKQTPHEAVHKVRTKCRHRIRET